MESVPVTLRYDLRPRDSRREAWPDAWSMAKAAWASRGRGSPSPVITIAR